MGVVTIVPKYHRLGEGFSKREKLQALEHPGRRVDGTQTASNWVSQLVELRKPLLLCKAWCAPKFNPRRHGFRKFYVPDQLGATDGYTQNGRCDGCKQNTELMPGGGSLFISEETYRLLCVDPVAARRKARLAARTLTFRVHMRGSRAPHDGAARKGA